MRAAWGSRVNIACSSGSDWHSRIAALRESQYTLDERTLAIARCGSQRERRVVSELDNDRVKTWCQTFDNSFLANGVGSDVLGESMSVK